MHAIVNRSDFVATWEKFVKPSLEAATGAMSSTISADDSTNQFQTPQIPAQSTTTRSSDETPRSTRCDLSTSSYVSISGVLWKAHY